MNNKKGSPNHKLSCEICEIESMSNAEFALHEFTKKHCDNLIRLSKNKPTLKKQKTKSKVFEAEKETVKVNTVTHTGSFAKYGYFVPGEIYGVSKDTKEFNSDYDPYLQKFAESSVKEKAMPLVVENFQQQCTAVLPSVLGVPKKKKKKKRSIKICQICNEMSLTASSYEAHMKSPEHILKLKVSGMGVSAHFVKASSDLHTTETQEDQKVDRDPNPLNDESNSQNSLFEFSLDRRDACELPLNSSQQLINDVSEKYQADCFKNKVTEGVLISSSSDKLFCFTCNILLNTVFQYNEHKYGKRHKIKCRALIRKGMTVPPEERVPGIGISNNDPSQPVYPELYVKMISERQKKSAPTTIAVGIGSSSATSGVESLGTTQSCHQNKEVVGPDIKSEDNMESAEIQNESNFTVKVLDGTSEHALVERPNTNFHEIIFLPSKINRTFESAPESMNQSSETASESNLENSSMLKEVFHMNETPELGNTNKESKSNITVLDVGEPLRCTICNESFEWQFQFDTHLTLEDHFKKIVELKTSGKSELDILNLLFADRNTVKPNKLGRLTCGICKVTADSKLEFEQHLTCVVHKYTEKDYKQKRTLEVKHLIPCDESGMYNCEVCKTKSTSLVEFGQHLFSGKHKSTQKRKKTFRSVGISRRQKLSQNLKRKYILLESLKAEKNSGVKAKIRGPATDACGAQSEVSGLELAEPKLEPAKSVGIGAGEKSAAAEAKKKLRKPNVRKRQNLFQRGRKILGRSLKQSNSGPTPPSLLAGDFYPSMNFSRFLNRPPSGWLPYPPSVRNAPPFYSHLPVPRPIYGRPPNNPFYRAPCFQRTPWLNYR